MRLTLQARAFWNVEIPTFVLHFKNKFMKKAKIKFSSYIAAVLLIVLASPSYAQVKPKTLRVSFLNQTIGLPSRKLTQLPIHPTLNIGTDFRVKTGKHWQRSLGIDAYYYYQRAFEQAFMLDATYRLGYKCSFGLQTNLTTAIGYKHAVLLGDKYQLVDGEFQEVSHFGKAQFNTKIGLGLEYPITETYTITTDYKVMAVAPFGDRILPFSVNTFLGAGLKINLKK